MEFKVNTGQAREIVNRITHCVENRAELDAFKEVAIRVAGGKMHFATTVPGAEIAEFLTLDEKQKSRLVTGVPAKTLQNILDTITEENFTFKVTDKQIHILAGKSHFRLSKKAADEVLFPEFNLDGLTWTDFDLDRFCRGSRKAASVAAKESSVTNQALVAVHIDNLHMVATDGKVMTVLPTPFPCVSWEFDIHHDRIQRVARALAKAGTEAQFAHNDHRLYIKTGNIVVSLTSLSVAYPNYKGLVISRVSSGKKKVPVPRAAFLSAIQQMAILSSTEDRIRVVKFSFTETGIVLSSKTAIGDSETEIECGPFSARTDTLLFDVDLLLKGLLSFDEENIDVIMEAPNLPSMFSEPGYAFFINPLRF